eukprot:9988665-Alexandrium_andersonii.AAC.1
MVHPGPLGGMPPGGSRAVLESSEARATFSLGAPEGWALVGRQPPWQSSGGSEGRPPPGDARACRTRCT